MSISSHIHSPNKSAVDYDNTSKESTRRLAANVFSTISRICAEKNVTNRLDVVMSEPAQRQYHIYYTAEKLSTTPYLIIRWLETRNGSFVIINMNEAIKSFRKRIKIDKTSTHENIINIAIDALVKQNEEHAQTKQMIENCVGQFQLNIKPNYIKRTKALWHISYKINNQQHNIVVQYDEGSKEFLFQKRFINSDDVIALVNTSARSLTNAV